MSIVRQAPFCKPNGKSGNAVQVSLAMLYSTLPLGFALPPSIKRRLLSTLTRQALLKCNLNCHSVNCLVVGGQSLPFVGCRHVRNGRPFAFWENFCRGERCPISVFSTSNDEYFAIGVVGCFSPLHWHWWECTPVYVIVCQFPCGKTRAPSFQLKVRAF